MTPRERDDRKRQITFALACIGAASLLGTAATAAYQTAVMTLRLMTEDDEPT